MNWIYGVLAIFVTILVHELGHFLMSIRQRVKVEEFGIGFKLFYPFKLFVWKGTRFVFNLIPFGGYVQYSDDETLEHIPRWSAIKIGLAGPFANSLLAGILFGVIYWLYDPELSILLIPVILLIGVLLSVLGTLLLIPVTVIAMFGILGWEGVGGPVTVVDLVNTAASKGLVDILLVLALINISVASLNLVPISPFDGGLIAKRFLEPMYAKHPVTKRIAGVIQVLGVLVLLHFIVRVFINDSGILLR